MQFKLRDNEHRCKRLSTQDRGALDNMGRDHRLAYFPRSGRCNILYLALLRVGQTVDDNSCGGNLSADKVLRSVATSAAVGGHIAVAVEANTKLVSHIRGNHRAVLTQVQAHGTSRGQTRTRRFPL